MIGRRCAPPGEAVLAAEMPDVVGPFEVQGAACRDRAAALAATKRRVERFLRRSRPVVELAVLHRPLQRGPYKMHYRYINCTGQAPPTTRSGSRSAAPQALARVRAVSPGADAPLAPQQVQAAGNHDGRAHDDRLAGDV